MKLFRDHLVKAYAEYCGSLFSLEDIAKQLTRIEDTGKKKRGYGDFSLPMFDFAEAVYQEKNAAVFAKELATALAVDGNLIERVEAMGPFINFYVNKTTLVETVLKEAYEEGENYGRSDIGKEKLVVIDYSAPNLGKPLHVGHIRSTILGDSLVKILEFSGHKTHGINYLGDIGLHTGKILAAYDMWGDKAKLEADPEEEILQLYIKFSKEENQFVGEKGEVNEDNEFTRSAKKTLELLEAGDPKYFDLWKFIADMSIKAFDRVYDLLDVHIDETVGQSKFSELGKEMILSALEQGKVKQLPDGAIQIDELKSLNNKYETLPPKMLLRSDGSAIYSTQDMGAAKYRKDTYNFDKLLYVVASEQDLYFEQLFGALYKLGHNWATDCKHISFGMIHLAEGRMSTREGTLVSLEEVLTKAVDMAAKVLNEKAPDLSNKDEVAKIIGIGAIKYMVLGVDYTKDITFSWDRALNFEGNSAPYIQYAYARASSILRKAGHAPQKFEVSQVSSDEEISLVKKIGDFPLVVESAAKNYKPHLIAVYGQELALAFNHYYRLTKVIGSEGEESKLYLVGAVRNTLKNSLGLLGIKVPEEM